MASFLILSLLLTEAAAGLVLVKEGETVTLDCSDSRTPIRAVEWIKEDRPPKNILFYTDGHLDPDHQHSTFKDRVELVNLQHEGGDLSLRLKDVVLSDTGTYKCLVAAGDSRRRKRAFIDGEPVRTIQLEVRGSTNEHTKNDNIMNDGNIMTNENTVNKLILRSFVGTAAGVVLFLVVVGLVVVFGHGVYKRRVVKRSEEDGAVNDHFIKHPVDPQNPDSSP
ncbi:programmed cell death 1 ligand 1-like isoform 1-T1 [Lycodopsis pacificus]